VSATECFFPHLGVFGIESERYTWRSREQELKESERSLGDLKHLGGESERSLGWIGYSPGRQILGGGKFSIFELKKIY
jgi:hypothetical protein